MTQRTIALTGATGRLGQAILPYLKAEMDPQHIIAIARDPNAISDKEVTCRAGDYADADSLTTACEGADTLIFISAPVVVGVDRVPLQRNVVNAAKAAGVRKIIYTSVAGSGAEKDTWFWDTQKDNRATEEDVKASGLAWIIARNALYLDLDVKTMKEKAASGVYQNNGGEGLAGYISIDEIAFATAKLALSDEHNSKTVNIIGDVHTQQELVDMANDIFGFNIRYESMSDDDNVARMMQLPHVAKRGEQVARMLTGCFQAIRAGAYNVPSDFEAITGRPCKPVKEMMIELRDAWTDA